MGCGASKEIKEDTSAHPFFSTWEKNGRPLVLGHRGGSLVHQENSLAAIKQMISAGVDGCEIDVFLSTDGKLFAFHDDNAERLTGTNLEVISASWEQLSKLKLKKELAYDGRTLTFDQEERIPLLSEIFETIKGTKFVLNVEMKPANPSFAQRGVGTAVAKLIREHGVHNQVICTSFDFFKLHALEKEFPGLQSGWQYDDDMTSLLGEANAWFEEEKSIAEHKFDCTASDFNFVRWLMEKDAVGAAVGATVVGIEHTCIDDDTIEKLHAKKMAVGSYTFFPIDFAAIKRKETDPAVVERESKNVLSQLFKRKVDWVETDDALTTLAYLNELKSQSPKA